MPATIEFADIAAAGAGTGQALVDVAAYRNADALVHVVRAFNDPSVPPLLGIGRSGSRRAEHGGRAHPCGPWCRQRLDRLERDLKKNRTADLAREHEDFVRCKQALESGTSSRALDLAGDDLKRLRGFQFLSAKPLLPAINLDEADVATVGGDVERAAMTVGLGDFLTHAATRAAILKVYAEIAELDPADASAFLADLGLHESGLIRVIRATYDLLGYISFFTNGDEQAARGRSRGAPWHRRPRARFTPTSRAGSSGPRWSRTEALVTRGSMAACCEHGEVRLEGKERRPGRRRHQLQIRDLSVRDPCAQTSRGGDRIATGTGDPGHEPHAERSSSNSVP